VKTGEFGTPGTAFGTLGKTGYKVKDEL